MKIFYTITFSLIIFSAGIFPAIGGEIKGKVQSDWVDSTKNIVVFIEDVASPDKFPPPKVRPKMDQKNLTFIPHILPIVVGTTVDFLNSDKVQHNVFSPSGVNRFNLGSYPPGDFKSVKYNKPGKVVLLCNVHPEMSAYIIVLKNPYFALTDADGKYVISNVPEGTYRLSTWHKNLATSTVELFVPEKGSVTANFNLFLGDPANLSKLLK
ncbi:MAG: carboxypeptidase regulatory-like domain-containing protein [bacterium]